MMRKSTGGPPCVNCVDNWQEGLKTRYNKQCILVSGILAIFEQTNFKSA